PRKGNTYSTLNFIKENYPDIDFSVLHLSKLDFQLCKRCYTCVKRGEDKCPIKDERDMIIGEMSTADGVILASPVYSHMVSAPMKNFFDRFGYYAHRPAFFDKYAMSLVTCSGYGAEEAIRYMNKMLWVFGFNLVPPLELNFRPGKMPEENRIRNEEKALEAFDRLMARIERGDRDKPTINMMVPFSIFKYVSEIDSETMSADYEYYKDKKDYYYDAKIPFYKKFITKKVVDKVVAGFD
ncbi:flavodoxin family protein, partial [Bacteroidota bacterium]